MIGLSFDIAMNTSHKTLVNLNLLLRSHHLFSFVSWPSKVMESVHELVTLVPKAIDSIQQLYALYEAGHGLVTVEQWRLCALCAFAPKPTTAKPGKNQTITEDWCKSGCGLYFIEAWIFCVTFKQGNESLTPMANFIDLFDQPILSIVMCSC